MKARRTRDDDGAAAVEFALLALPFIALILGAMQYGYYFYVSQSTAGAASNVVRRIQVGDCWQSGQALTLAKTQSAMVTEVDPALIPTTTARGATVTITLKANGKIPLFFPLPDDGVISKVVKARVEDTTSSGTC